MNSNDTDTTARLVHWRMEIFYKIIYFSQLLILNQQMSMTCKYRTYHARWQLHLEEVGIIIRIISLLRSTNACKEFSAAYRI